MSIAHRIKNRRKELGLTQEAVARTSGISNSGYVMLERGERTDPHVSTLRKISKVLHTSVSELIGEEQEIDTR